MGRDCMFAADLTGHTCPTLFLCDLQALGSAAAVSRRLMNDTGGIRDPQPRSHSRSGLATSSSFVPVISSLRAVVAVLCSGQLSDLLTLRRPALGGRKAAKPDFAEDQGGTFDKLRVP